jgi:peptidoglycan-associated lipoprotein
MLKTMVAAAGFAAALGACSTLPGQEAFDPASCYEREFNVYFDGADATLSPEARDAINLVGTALRGCRIEHVRVVGMADAVEEASISDEISQARAVAISDYLQDEFHWREDVFELRARGDRGALTDEGLARPVRARARVVVQAVAP